jgi:hypothetical protein
MVEKAGVRGKVFIDPLRIINTEIIDKDDIAELTCKICLGILVPPAQECTECQQTFCMQCVSVLNNRCPYNCTSKDFILFFIFYRINKLLSSNNSK